MRDTRNGRAKIAAAEEARRTPERRAIVKARAYVHVYLRRGKLQPPVRCELCDEPRELVAYHPAPERPREIAWLCTRCASRATTEELPIVLRWTWPGDLTAPLPPSSFTLASDTLGRVAALVADRVSPKRGREANAAYMTAFFEVVGERERELLYAAGDRVLDLARWTPYGQPQLDRLVQDWFVRERDRRVTVLREPDIDVVDDVRVVTLPPRNERKMKRQLSADVPAVGAAVADPPPSDAPRRSDAELDASIAASFDQVDAILARVAAREAEHRARGARRENDAPD
jgi:hypothetical protein